MIKDILEKHNVYSTDLELDLLRHFEKLRNEMLQTRLDGWPSGKRYFTYPMGWCPIHHQMF